MWTTPRSRALPGSLKQNTAASDRQGRRAGASRQGGLRERLRQVDEGHLRRWQPKLSTGVSGGRDRYAQLARFAGNVATPASSTSSASRAGPTPVEALRQPRRLKPVADARRGRRGRYAVPRSAKACPRQGCCYPVNPCLLLHPVDVAPSKYRTAGRPAHEFWISLRPPRPPSVLYTATLRPILRLRSWPASSPKSARCHRRP